MSAMAAALHTRTARWLLAFFVLLIAYGSLFPFELRHVDVHGPLDVVRRLRWGISTRGDIFANVLLYLPFGAALAFAQPAGTALRRVLVATLAGAALSLTVELAQVFLVSRVASWADVVNNTLGSFTGAAAAVAVGAAADRLNASQSFRLTREPVAAALVVVWLATFLPPWLPPLDAARWPAEWARLAAAGWPQARAAALDALGWTVTAAALATLTRAEWVYRALVVLSVGALALQFTAFVHFANAAEPVGVAAALVAWPFLGRLGERPRAGVLLALVAGALAWRSLAPFRFAYHPGPFNLVPFADLISRGSTGFNLPLFFGKAFWYGSMVWLAVRRGAAPLAAGGGVAAFLLALEIAQLWLRGGGHVASVTDPLVALAAGVVTALLATVAGPNPTARSPAKR
jgi:VanZ family protein